MAGIEGSLTPKMCQGKDLSGRVVTNSRSDEHTNNESPEVTDVDGQSVHSDEEGDARGRSSFELESDENLPSEEQELGPGAQEDNQSMHLPSSIMKRRLVSDIPVVCGQKRRKRSNSPTMTKRLRVDEDSWVTASPIIPEFSTEGQPLSDWINPPAGATSPEKWSHNQRKQMEATIKRAKDDILREPSHQYEPFQWTPKRLIPYQNPDTNKLWARYMELREAGVPDPRAELMRELGMPCSTRIETPQGEDPVKRKSKQANIRTVNGDKPAQASRMKQDDCKAFGWEFCDLDDIEIPEDDSTDEWHDVPLKDMTIPPKRGRSQGKYGLADSIIKLLKEDKAALGDSRLNLPGEWEAIADPNNKIPAPPAVLLPHYYDFYDTGANCVYGKRVKQKANAAAQSIVNNMTPSTDKVKSSSPLPAQDEIDLAEELVRKYPLTGGFEKIRRMVPAMIKDLKGRVERRNLYDSKGLLVNEIKKMHGYNSCVRFVPVGEPQPLTSDWPPAAIHSWLHAKCTKRATAETTVEAGGGSELRKIFLSTKHFNNTSTQDLEFPPHMRLLGSVPRPDFFGRVLDDGQLKWHPHLLPVLFTAEGKPMIRLRKQALAQLAASVNPTMEIFISYFLHQRSSDDALLPEWLYLYGIRYTEHGFDVYAYFPYRDFDSSSWKFACALVTGEHQRIWHTTTPINRFSSLNVAQMILQQAHNILEKLIEWKDAEAALVIFETDL